MIHLSKGAVSTNIGTALRVKHTVCSIIRCEALFNKIFANMLSYKTCKAGLSPQSQNNCYFFRTKSTMVMDMSLMTPPSITKSNQPRKPSSSPISSEEKNKLYINSKRFERSKRRFPDHINQYNTRSNLSKSFITQREKICELFADESNINELFSSIPSDKETKLIRTFKQMKEIINNGNDVSYYNSDIRNSLMLLASSFINSILVEINVRKTFHDKSINKYSSSSIFRENLFENIKSKDKKNEMYKILVGLYDLEEAGVPSCLDQFMKKLHPESVDHLINLDLKDSDSFNSLEFFRYNFIYYKTSQYLNYDHSDTMRFIQAECPIKFNSQEVNNQEYLESFDKSFKFYDSKNCLGHLELALRLVRDILNCQKYTPDYTIFRYLLERLGSLRLLNYQSLIYDVLPSVDDSRLILAKPVNNSVRLSRMSHQFQDLIESYPDFLISLLRYQVPRGDSFTLQELLTFFNLKQVQDHAKLLKKTNLLGLVSQSRFKNKDIRLAFVEYKSEAPVLISVCSIYTAIECCLHLKQYEYIDLLFTKLILNLCENDSKLKIVLSFGKNETSALACRDSLLISQGLPVTTIASKIFTKEILKLLLKACVESDDVGRLLWLLPHLDNYLSRNIDLCKSHLENIRNYLNKTIIHAETFPEREYREFIKADRTSKIDMDLISDIYKTLKDLRLDGRILTYDKLLNFATTDRNHVKLFRKKIVEEKEQIKSKGVKVKLNSYSDDFYFSVNSTKSYVKD